MGGFIAVGLGLFGWLIWTHLRGGRYFDRPGFARHRLFDPILIAASVLLVAAGLLLLWRSSKPAAAVVASALSLLWAYRRLIRAASFQRWLLRRDYRSLRRRHPDLPERAILVRLVIERHPGWGEELVEQMVLDYPSLDDIAPLLARMELGFRAFRSGRRAGSAAMRGGAERSDPAPRS